MASGSRELTFKDALGEAMIEEMQRNKNVFLMGEDMRVFFGGGTFGITPKEKFLDQFGPERIRDTPIIPVRMGWTLGPTLYSFLNDIEKQRLENP